MADLITYFLFIYFMVKDNIENPCSSYDPYVETIDKNGVYVNDKNVDVYDVNVQPQTKDITITENGTYIPIQYETEYFNEVTVDVQPPLQEKEKALGINERAEITPDDGYYGLSKVVVQSPPVPLQNKTLNVTENGSTRLMPDEGYYALHTVDVNVDVNPELENKTIEIIENGTTTITKDDGYYGLSSVTVNTNVQPKLQDTDITITENGRTEISKDDSYDGFGTVSIITNVQPALQNKTVEYTENGQYSVTNDEGFYGLKEAKINVSIPNVSTAVTITENGTTTLRPESGYYNQVDIDVQVPDPELESKTIDITQNGTMNIAPDSAYGLSNVTVNTNVQPELESKTVEITQNGLTYIEPDSAYGLSNVTVNTNVQPPLQEKEVPIGLNERVEVTPDTDYYGLSKVVVQSPDVPLQNKTLNVTENGSTRLMPDEGYYALHIVDVNVNVPEPSLESKTVDITSNGTMNITPDSEYGLSNVTVNTNVQPTLQNKTVTITNNGTQTITKDDGYDGLGNVTVTTNVEGGGSIGNYINIETPFYGTSIIQCINGTLDITKWDLQIVKYYKTFCNLEYLNKIILPIDFFYVENRNDIIENYTFQNCTSLAEIENIDKTRISINSFNHTFYNCTSLTSLDLSYKPEYNYWDLSGVESMNDFFEGCSNLTTLNIDGWDRTKLSYSSYMFSNCSNLGGIIRLSAHNAKYNDYMFSNCRMIDEIYYDNDGYNNEDPNKEVCKITYFANSCTNLKKASIKGRNIYNDQYMFNKCTNIEWVDMTGCDYSKYMSGITSTANAQPYTGCAKLKTLIGDHTLQEVENGDITIYNGLGISKPRFKAYYFSPLSSLRYSSMLAIAKGLGQHTYTTTQYIRLNETAWNNMYNDDDTIPDSNTITQRQTIITDLITSKGWSIQTANS